VFGGLEHVVYTKQSVTLVTIREQKKSSPTKDRRTKSDEANDGLEVATLPTE
jgi:hypothetical protein